MGKSSSKHSAARFAGKDPPDEHLGGSEFVAQCDELNPLWTLFNDIWDLGMKCKGSHNVKLIKKGDKIKLSTELFKAVLKRKHKKNEPGKKTFFGNCKQTFEQKPVCQTEFEDQDEDWDEIKPLYNDVWNLCMQHRGSHNLKLIKKKNEIKLSNDHFKIVLNMKKNKKKSLNNESFGICRQTITYAVQETQHSETPRLTSHCSVFASDFENCYNSVHCLPIEELDGCPDIEQQLGRYPQCLTSDSSSSFEKSYCDTRNKESWHFPQLSSETSKEKTANFAQKSGIINSQSDLETKTAENFGERTCEYEINQKHSIQHHTDPYQQYTSSDDGNVDENISFAAHDMANTSLGSKQNGAENYQMHALNNLTHEVISPKDAFENKKTMKHHEENLLPVYQSDNLQICELQLKELMFVKACFQLYGKSTTVEPINYSTSEYTSMTHINELENEHAADGKYHIAPDSSCNVFDSLHVDETVVLEDPNVCKDETSYKCLIAENRNTSETSYPYSSISDQSLNSCLTSDVSSDMTLNNVDKELMTLKVLPPACHLTTRSQLSSEKGKAKSEVTVYNEQKLSLSLAGQEEKTLSKTELVEMFCLLEILSNLWISKSLKGQGIGREMGSETTRVCLPGSFYGLKLIIPHVMLTQIDIWILNCHEELLQNIILVFKTTALTYPVIYINLVDITMFKDLTCLSNPNLQLLHMLRKTNQSVHALRNISEIKFDRPRFMHAMLTIPRTLEYLLEYEQRNTRHQLFLLPDMVESAEEAFQPLNVFKLGDQLNSALKTKDAESVKMFRNQNIFVFQDFQKNRAEDILGTCESIKNFNLASREYGSFTCKLNGFCHSLGTDGCPLSVHFVYLVDHCVHIHPEVAKPKTMHLFIKLGDGIEMAPVNIKHVGSPTLYMYNNSTKCSILHCKTQLPGDGPNHRSCYTQEMSCITKICQNDALTEEHSQQQTTVKQPVSPPGSFTQLKSYRVQEVTDESRGAPSGASMLRTRSRSCLEGIMEGSELTWVDDLSKQVVQNVDQSACFIRDHATSLKRTGFQSNLDLPDGLGNIFEADIDRPPMEKELARIATITGFGWTILGAHLDIPLVTLDQRKTDNNQNYMEQVRQMLLKWKQKNGHSAALKMILKCAPVNVALDEFLKDLGYSRDGHADVRPIKTCADYMESCISASTEYNRSNDCLGILRQDFNGDHLKVNSNVTALLLNHNLYNFISIDEVQVFLATPNLNSSRFLLEAIVSDNYLVQIQAISCTDHLYVVSKKEGRDRFYVVTEKKETDQVYGVTGKRETDPVYAVTEKKETNQAYIVTDNKQIDQVYTETDKKETDQVCTVTGKKETNQVHIVTYKKQTYPVSMVTGKKETDPVLIVTEKKETDPFLIVTGKKVTDNVHIVTDKKHADQVHIVTDKQETDPVQMITYKKETDEVLIAIGEKETDNGHIVTGKLENDPVHIVNLNKETGQSYIVTDKKKTDQVSVETDKKKTDQVHIVTGQKEADPVQISTSKKETHKVHLVIDEKQTDPVSMVTGKKETNPVCNVTEKKETDPVKKETDEVHMVTDKKETDQVNMVTNKNETYPVHTYLYDVESRRIDYLENCQGPQNPVQDNVQVVDSDYVKTNQNKSQSRNIMWTYDEHVLKEIFKGQLRKGHTCTFDDCVPTYNENDITDNDFVCCLENTEVCNGNIPRSLLSSKDSLSQENEIRTRKKKALKRQVTSTLLQSSNRELTVCSVHSSESSSLDSSVNIYAKEVHKVVKTKADRTKKLQKRRPTGDKDVQNGQRSLSCDSKNDVKKHTLKMRKTRIKKCNSTFQTMAGKRTANKPRQNKLSKQSLVRRELQSDDSGIMTQTSTDTDSWPSWRTILRECCEETQQQLHQIAKNVAQRLYLGDDNQLNQAVAVYGLRSFFNRVNTGDPLTREEELQFEWLRFITFHNYEGEGNGIALARNGFYHDHNQGPNATRCFACDAVREEWTLLENVEETHRRISPNCPLLRNNSGEGTRRNISIAADDGPQRAASTANVNVRDASATGVSQSSAATSTSQPTPSSSISQPTPSGSIFPHGRSPANFNHPPTPETIRQLDAAAAARRNTSGTSTTQLTERLGHAQITESEEGPRSILAQPTEDPENRQAHIHRAGYSDQDRSVSGIRPSDMFGGGPVGHGAFAAQSLPVTTPQPSQPLRSSSAPLTNLPLTTETVTRSSSSATIAGSTQTTTTPPQQTAVIQPSETEPRRANVALQRSSTPLKTVSAVLERSSQPRGPDDPRLNVDLTTGIYIERPRHPEYNNLQTRIDTFTDWPAHLDQDTRQLAELGFFHVGVADFVRCFACGGGLRNWERGDNPLVEHIRWFPNCEYMRKLKGQHIIDLVLRHVREQEAAEGAAASRTSDLNTTDPLQSELGRSLIDMGFTEDQVKDGITGARQRLGRTDVTANEVIDWLDANRPPSAAETKTQLRAVVRQEDTTTTSTTTTTSSSSRSANTLTTSHSQVNVEVAVAGANITATATTATSMTAGGNNDDEEEYETPPEGNASGQAKNGGKKKKKRKSKGGNAASKSSNEGATAQQTENLDPAAIQKENERLRDMQTCKICMERPVDTTLLPCGHLVTCNVCAQRLAKCPICRKKKEGAVRTFMS